jgi:threonyl-tRNA synthetase
MNKKNNKKIVGSNNQNPLVGKKASIIPPAVSGFELVKKAKVDNVIAIRDVAGTLANLSDTFHNYDVEFVDKSSYDGLCIIRHSTAHLMAAAIAKIYPKALFTIGPDIENGFYYDIDFKSTKISSDDLPKIEAEMNKLVKADIKFVKKEITQSAALKLFKGNPYKIELIKELGNQQITIYQFGDFVDLCRGPHVPSSRYLKFFKLTKIGGAY